MALIPEFDSELLDEVETAETETAAPIVKTYALDFETGIIGGLVDGDEAIRQVVIKTLMTDRAKFIAYSEDYGSELRELIGEDLTDALLDAEIPRMVYESLIYDDRIADVTDVEFSREGDSLFINVTVVPAEGGEEIDVEVVI